MHLWILWFCVHFAYKQAYLCPKMFAHKLNMLRFSIKYCVQIELVVTIASFGNFFGCSIIHGVKRPSNLQVILGRDGTCE